MAIRSKTSHSALAKRLDVDHTTCFYIDKDPACLDYACDAFQNISLQYLSRLDGRDAALIQRPNKAGAPYPCGKKENIVGCSSPYEIAMDESAFAR